MGNKVRNVTRNMVRKPLKDLTLMDRFLFAQTMENPLASRMLLEIIFGTRIKLLNDSETEKEFRRTPLARSIRIDVYSMDDQNRVYDTEVQGENTGDLPQRTRFYQALIDSTLLEPGTTDFGLMKDCHVIMIAPFDLMGKGRYRYTFQMRCEEEADLALGDGGHRIFLNTRGTNPEGVSEELIELLHYMENATGDYDIPVRGERLKVLDDCVKAVRVSEEIGVKYMQAWEERIMDRLEGKEEGAMLKLISMTGRMLEKGLSAEEIADMTGEMLDVVQEICNAIKANPDYSAEEIYDVL